MIFILCPERRDAEHENRQRARQRSVKCSRLGHCFYFCFHFVSDFRSDFLSAHMADEYK